MCPPLPPLPHSVLLPLWRPGHFLVPPCPELLLHTSFTLMEQLLGTTGSVLKTSHEKILLVSHGHKPQFTL
ncbi:unnamed protein product [Pleuronectes platessa]|uniref:Uncharacterized protein n=1 Tax=Pleuronectes platessa TaxID=8262 RepID=A0A9N7YNR0_PLEPL|nr:unnamed protein product [Pleuronectes platessa]